MAVDKAVPYHGLSWLLAHGMDRGYFHTVSQSSIYGRIPYTVLCAALLVQLLQVNNQSGQLRYFRSPSASHYLTGPHSSSSGPSSTFNCSALDHKLHLSFSSYHLITYPSPRVCVRIWNTSIRQGMTFALSLPLCPPLPAILSSPSPKDPIPSLLVI